MTATALRWYLDTLEKQLVSQDGLEAVQFPLAACWKINRSGLSLVAPAAVPRAVNND